ncbi:Ig-like domain-containing protein [Hyalangium gracile]|uniref:Ig-like domain-containing protein n=1 Tax=Hyalangium gracile TaxID=394092 RepID=UPI001CCB2E05|nr:Ig-like domain-containing protein [Hyalangium gracile]
MASLSLPLRWWLQLVVLALGISVVGCGGGDTPTPIFPQKELPDAARSKVEVSRAANVTANGKDSVTITVTVVKEDGSAMADRTVRLEVSGEGNTLTPPSGLTNAQGVMMATLVSSGVGSKRVTASVDDDGGPVTLTARPTIDFVPPVATKLAFGAASLQAIAGAPVGPMLEVILQDADGNRASGNTGAVTLELASAPEGAQLEGTLTVNAVDGVARFTDVVSIKKAGEGYSLRATSGLLTAATSATFAVVPAAPSVLELSGQPLSMPAGGSFSMRVKVKDAFSNLATNYTGTLRFSSTDASAGLPPDTAFTAADAGEKAFTNVSLHRAGSQQLTVTDSANAALTTSATVQVVAGAASRLAFTQQPGNRSVRAALGPVAVAITDGFGNVIAVSSPSITVALTPASGGLGGTTTVAPVDGVATFSNLSVAQEGNGYTLAATAGSLTGASSASFNVVDDVAPAVPVLSQGATTASSIVVRWTAVGDDGDLGTVTSQELRYSTSNIVTDADFAAATQVTTGAPQAAGSPESVTLSGLTPSSTYYVALKVTDNVGNTVRSATLPVSTDNPVVTQLAFLTQPADGTAGSNLAQVRLALQDADGNTVTSANSAVTLSLLNGPVYTASTIAVNGVATFSTLRVDTAGSGYRFQASSGSLPTVQSNAFAIQPAPGASLELVGLSLPQTAGTPGTVKLTVHDAFNNVATGYLGTVHFTSSDAQAVLPADYTFSATDMGTAEFSVELRTAGPQSVTVSGTQSVTGATLPWGIIEAGEPQQLAFSVQPVNGSVRTPLAEVAVVLKDAFGNNTTAFSPTVTLGLSGGNPTAALSGTQNADPSNGVASFGDLSIDQEGTGFRLEAIAPGLTGASSAPFNIVDGIAPGVAIIAATVTSTSSATVTWTAVGDDADLGTAASYDLRYASAAITTEAQFAAATRFNIPPPKATGEAESALVTGLDLSSEVFFALKVIDGAGNASGLSNSPKVGGDPCSGVTCTPPANSCTANGRTVVSYTSACVDSGGVGVCQDTPSPVTTCQSYETCSAGACVPVTAASQAGRIIFSEFNTLGAEYIELRNTTNAPIDVHGFTLRNLAGEEVDVRAITDPNGTAGTPVEVPANGVLYGIPNPSGAIPVGTGFVYGAPGTTWAMADSGDALALYAAPAGNLEDALDFRAFATDPNVPLTAVQFVGFAGNTTQLDSDVVTAAGNDTAINWCVSFYGHGVRGSRVTNTLGALNGSCKVAVINEAIIDGPGADDQKTFVEIAGPGGSVIGGAKITDVEGTTAPTGGLNADGNLGTGETDGEFVIPAGRRIPVDGILLVADANAAVTTTQVPGFTPGVDVLARDMDMEDGGGDVIQLVSASGTLLDTLGHDLTSVSWTNNTAYNGLPMYETATALYTPLPSATWAASIARSPQSTDSGHNRNDFHIDPSPTPGQPNDVVNFTVTGMTPDDGPATAGALNITVTGTDFSPGSSAPTQFASLSATFGQNGSRPCTVVSSTQATCTAVSNRLNAVEKVDVTFTNSPVVGVPDVVLSQAFTYTGNENETNSGNEADFCNLQSPASIIVAANSASPVIYGQLYEAGITEQPGPPGGWIAEVGYGNASTDPRSNNTWRFFPASYNPSHQSNNDEFMGTFVAPSYSLTTPNNYAFTFRFSVDNGMRWTYCDLNGAGTNTGLTFESTQLGTMTVTQ